jgi:hypothetical protein
MLPLTSILGPSVNGDPIAVALVLLGSAARARQDTKSSFAWLGVLDPGETVVTVTAVAAGFVD